MEELFPHDIPITPLHIDTLEPFWGAFGNSETETSANYIVRFFQDEIGGWSDFLYGETNAYYRKKREQCSPGSKDQFTFNRLVTGGWIKIIGTQPEDDLRREHYTYGTKFRITPKFVAACYGSSPTTPAKFLAKKDAKEQKTCSV